MLSGVCLCQSVREMVWCHCGTDPLLRYWWEEPFPWETAWRVCRTAELLLTILPQGQQGASHRKMILEPECITILHACLFLFIINELVCDHGFKKLVVAKEEGCLPLVLDCRTGPCLFNDVTVFISFILLSVLKKRAQRLLLYFLYPSGNISSPRFSTAIRNF